jgi:TPP-dependent pyruvate/acetoin dehydrogenase alpha subunit
MGGHATHDEREARETFDGKLFAHWGKRDPVGLFENHLTEGTLDLESGRRVRRSPSLRDRNASMLKQAEERVTAEVELAISEALASKGIMPSPESAAEGVYAENEASLEFRV